MMPRKNRVRQIIKVKTATVALIPLTMGLGFILAPPDYLMAGTLGTACPFRPSHLAYGLVAFGIVYKAGKVEHLRLRVTFLQVS